VPATGAAASAASNVPQLVCKMNAIALYAAMLDQSQQNVGQISKVSLLRATAVPAGTAVARISYGNSVRPSVRHNPVRIQGQVRQRLRVFTI